MELVIAMTYGSALFDAAKELGKLEMIKEEIGEIDRIFKGEQEFVELLNSPAIPQAKKKEMIRNVFRGKTCEEVVSLLFILVDKGRISHFHNIVKEYLRLYDQYHSEVYGKVYSVVSLSDEEIHKLERETGILLKEKVRLKNVIDPSLLGGVKIEAGGKLIDASLCSRLKDLQTAIHQI